MEIEFKEGDEVYERIRPGQKLIISRHLKGIYYCKVVENLHRKELIFAARELMTRKLAVGRTA
jgi:hypothetical protein